WPAEGRRFRMMTQPRPFALRLPRLPCGRVSRSLPTPPRAPGGGRSGTRRGSAPGRRRPGPILGSPTDLGGVSGPFKSLMASTGRLWREQRLKGRLAAGFTVSSLPAGDKQSMLLSMVVFATQHGIWVGSPVMPEQHRGVFGGHFATTLLRLDVRSDSVATGAAGPESAHAWSA